MMVNNSLYSDERWQRFKDKFGNTSAEFKLKKYPQLDPYFDFLNFSEQIQAKVCDPTLKAIRSHSFLPFLKILTKTPKYRYQEDKASYSLDTKVRPISFASHFDSYIYAYYSFALTEEYQSYLRDKDFKNCILAYRTDLGGLCNIQFAKEAFNRVNDHIHRRGRCTAIALDITGYFDNIDHGILKEKWCKILSVNELPIDQYKVFRSLTKYSYVNYISFLKHFDINLSQLKKQNVRWQSILDLLNETVTGPSFAEKFNFLRAKKLISTNQPKKNINTGELESRGIPQGSSMSSVLSNIYLIDFDEFVNKLSNKLDFSYRRYCDDLLIICNTADAEDISAIVLSEIKKYKLVIQTKKAERIDFALNSKGKIRGFNYKKMIKNPGLLNPENESRLYKSLQYLGFEFNGQDVYVRPGSLSRFFQKMKGRITKTIMMSYSSRSRKEQIMKKQIFERYSHLGKRNFLSYVQDAAKKSYTKSSGIPRQGFDSPAIRKQLAHHFKIIEQEIIKTSEQRFTQKEKQHLSKLFQNKRTKKATLKK